MSAQSQFQQLQSSSERIDIAVLQDFFDRLEALPAEFMLGEWDGGVFNTGHPGEKQLGALNWHGKAFHSANDVNPIISHDADGKRVLNPVLGTACLRSVAYRGVVTTTMVYDSHPIFDHFRKIDESTVLGVMDRKGDEMPLFFFLKRI
ncbi:MAG: DUF4334 domain-containing protein [Moraxellaceae bacterium]